MARQPDKDATSPADSERQQAPCEDGSMAWRSGEQPPLRGSKTRNHSPTATGNYILPQPERAGKPSLPGPAHTLILAW